MTKTMGAQLAQTEMPFSMRHTGIHEKTAKNVLTIPTCMYFNAGMGKHDFNDHLTELLEDIQDLTELAEYHLDDLHDWDPGDGKFQRAAELVTYYRTLKQMESDLDKMALTFGKIREDLAEDLDSAHRDSQTKLRTFTVTVTDGMIRNSMLTLSAAVRNGEISIGEQLSIQPPHSEPFKTLLMQPGNRLRERKRIREFYETEKVTPGDKVSLSEIEPGIWQLSKGNCHMAALTKALLDESNPANQPNR
jgi:hypothetical protein